MAHGTGIYMIPVEKATINMGDYVIYVYKERNYFYEDMSDCYAPTYRETGKYEISVEEKFVGHFGSCLRKKYGKCGLTREQAVRFWKYFKACEQTYNVPSPEDAVKYLKNN